MELGKKQTLYVVKRTDFGVYLNENEQEQEGFVNVLLPRKQVPEETQIGDQIEVFLYRDSMDRLIATTNTPKLTLGECAKLSVIEVGTIGAFMDWGLEKDLLLPFKEQTVRVRTGREYLVALYVDKSKRLCATMKLYHYLLSDSPYKENDNVSGTVYEIIDEMGAFVAIDDMYQGLIPMKELHRKIAVGDIIEGRVANVKEDGKLDISLSKKAYLQMDDDCATIMETIDSYDGVLPFTDKAIPAVIERELGMSKNAFKRAIGRLLKQDKIIITEKNILKQ